LKPFTPKCRASMRPAIDCLSKSGEGCRDIESLISIILLCALAVACRCDGRFIFKGSNSRLSNPSTLCRMCSFT
jgi:hypothetical protein